MTYWMCEKCNFVIETVKPPDPCPSCHIKCVFTDVTSYTPDYGGVGSLDSRLVAQRVMKKERSGKIVRFSDLIRGRTSEGKEKHVPAIEISKSHGKKGKDTVEIVVGREVPHPNTEDHHIVWIQAFGARKDGQVLDLGRAIFKPGVDKPVYSFEIDSSEFKHLFAFSYCNKHGVWEQHLEV
ncbi:MAG: desulfoferrodoxin family protein [Dehalococcoidia bacterium]|nr:desulfoferrodoxin family protein [Dehalococcoidia bacterium]MDD5494878.1 desulfoferrodoxin family protein [Dehalococcoidia bacterium]